MIMHHAARLLARSIVQDDAEADRPRTTGHALGYSCFARQTGLLGIVSGRHKKGGLRSLHHRHHECWQCTWGPIIIINETYTISCIVVIQFISVILIVIMPSFRSPCRLNAATANAASIAPGPVLSIAQSFGPGVFISGWPGDHMQRLHAHDFTCAIATRASWLDLGSSYCPTFTYAAYPACRRIVVCCTTVATPTTIATGHAHGA